MDLLEKIKGCQTMRELDELRIDIVISVQNRADFEVLQKAFIKKKNSLKRNGHSRFKEGYSLNNVEAKLDFEQKNIMYDIGNLQTKYQSLIEKKKMTKKAICDLVIPFRDRYGITDLQALQIARNEMTISEINHLIIK